MRTPILLLCALLMGGCAHRAVEHKAPSATKLIAAQGKLHRAVDEARVEARKVSVGVVKIKEQHRQEVALVAALKPQLVDIRKGATPELLAKIDVMQANIEQLETAQAETEAHVRAVETSERVLSIRLEEAETAKAEVLTLSPPYLAEVDQLVAKANTAEKGWEADSREVIRLRMGSWLFRILSAVGAIAVGLLLILYFTGKIALNARR